MAGSYGYSRRSSLLKALMHLVTLCFSSALMAYSFVVKKFDIDLKTAYKIVYMVGHQLKNVADSVVAKVSGVYSTACNGFVSLRRSLDASNIVLA